MHNFYLTECLFIHENNKISKETDERNIEKLSENGEELDENSIKEMDERNKVVDESSNETDESIKEKDENSSLIMNNTCTTIELFEENGDHFKGTYD